ncbi:DUF1444 family protein [Actinocatenispora rupis]|nr:DUF1444 family protein [Actinocatenispora rupis]
MSRDAAEQHPAVGPDAPLLEEWYADLVVGFLLLPQFGDRLITTGDLEALDMRPRSLRRTAAENLEKQLDRVDVHGLPPVFTLSFDGLEAALLTSDEVWSSLEAQVEGEIVVGVPARDVMFVTGSKSQAGLEKIHRACERIFFAGHENLLSRHLLVRRQGIWHTF